MSICKKCKKKNFCVTYAYLLSRGIGLPNECDDFIGEQTNEEWFCGLSTEEKANFFHDIVIRAVQATWDGKKPDYPAYLYDWKKWLKEKHQ